MKVKAKVPELSRANCLELGQDIGKVEKSLSKAWQAAVGKTGSVMAARQHATWALQDADMLAHRFPKSKGRVGKVISKLRAAINSTTKRSITKRLVDVSNEWRPIRDEAYRTCK